MELKLANGSPGVPVVQAAPGLLIAGLFPQPIAQDLVVYRGDTGKFRVTVVDQNGQPVDVSAATWDCDIRDTADGALIVSLTVTPVAGTPSAVDVVLTAAQSAQLAVAGVWDLEMTLAGEVHTLLAGKVTVTKDVSRAAP